MKNRIFINMLPKNFQNQNIIKKNTLTSTLKLYTITYDYELTYYYGEYIKESYNNWGNIVDSIGVMKLTGYEKEEVEFNFTQLMSMYYLNTHKLSSYTLIDIREELIGGETIS